MTLSPLFIKMLFERRLDVNTFIMRAGYRTATQIITIIKMRSPYYIKRRFKLVICTIVLFKRILPISIRHFYIIINALL